MFASIAREQSGFRSSKGTIDKIFLAKKIQEDALKSGRLFIKFSLI